MRISDASVGSFRELWRKHYGAELTEAQASDYAEFLGLVKLIVEPELHHLEKRKPP